MPYQYRCIRFNLDHKKGSSGVGGHDPVGEQFESFINQHADGGWEFYSIELIDTGVSMRSFRALFSRTNGLSLLNMAVFRKQIPQVGVSQVLNGANGKTVDRVGKDSPGQTNGVPAIEDHKRSAAEIPEVRQVMESSLDATNKIRRLAKLKNNGMILTQEEFNDLAASILGLKM
jgi:hypothetical protein